MSGNQSFWKTTALEDMTQQQWESLCDGCGRCCLNKLEDCDTGEIAWTDIACRLLDEATCRCKSYARRVEFVADCIPLDARKINELTWLPATCAYRIIADGGDLMWWHKLVSGNPESVHQAGISVRGRVRDEALFNVDDYQDYIVTWPEEYPAN